MKKSWKLRLGAMIFSLIFLFAGAFAGAEETAPTEEAPEIGAEYAVIFNADDGGEILYGKNAITPVYCGFLPRVMTCLLIAESGKVEEEITVTRGMLVDTPQISMVALKAGDKISYGDLITCILVGNSQEAAVAAATSLAGSWKEFVKKMNDKAAELGATDTLFTNVTGNYVANTKQITTLADCAKIISAALQQPLVAERAILRTGKITVNGKERNIYTRNMLIEPTNGNYSEAAKGLFIYSQSVSNSSIATCRKDSERNIISVAITTKGLDSLYKDAATLLKYSKNRYISKTLLAEGKTLAEVPVKNGKGVDFVTLTGEEELTALVPKIYGETAPTLTVNLPSEVEAPVEKGVVLGTVTVSLGGKEYGTVNLITQGAVEMDYFELYSGKLMKFFKNPWLWVILVGVLVVVVGYMILIYQINKPKKKMTPKGETGSRIRMTGGDEEED